MELGVSSIAALGLHLATRSAPAARGRAVRNVDDLSDALDRGALRVNDTVRLGHWTTTVGRHMVAACLPPSFRAVAEAPWDQVRGTGELSRIVRELHVEIAARCVELLEVLGRRIADRSGLSLALDDFLPPAEARDVIDEARSDAAGIENEYLDGMITDGERFNRQCDIWSRAGELARMHARRRAPACDSLAACAASQREPIHPHELRAMRGAMAVPFGDIATGLTGTLGEGIAAHEYFLRAMALRRDTLIAAERHRLATEMLADLDAAIGDVQIVAVDCGTARGVRVRAIVYEEDVRGSLATRIAGSVTAEDVCDRTGTLLAPAGTLLEPALARRIEAAQIASVLLRDVRTCEAAGGVCSRCFGLGPEDALWTCVGDDVGARAAFAIAAVASRLPPRRIYHIC